MALQSLSSDSTILASLQSLTPYERKKLLAEASAEQLRRSTTKAPPIWTPFPGPQTRALNSKADVLFFGGAAGPGKTTLLLGVAAMQHQFSIIFRREFKQLEDIRQKAEMMYRDY